MDLWPLVGVFELLYNEPLGVGLSGKSLDLGSMLPVGLSFESS